MGKGADQRRFTAYHDRFTQRSEFFRAARSDRWSHDPSKPTILDDVHPEVFSAYLHTVNFGAELLHSIVQSLMDKYPCYQRDSLETNVSERGSNIGNAGSATAGNNNKAGDAKRGSDAAAPGTEDPGEANTSILEEFRPVERYLIDVYLLADKLIDPISANLAMDELIAVIETRCEYLGAALIRFVYKSTMEDSPLRRLVRDHSMIDNAISTSNSEQFRNNNFPYDFVKDILLEVWAINRNNADAKIRKVYCLKELEPHLYHYEVDNDA